MVVNIHRLKNSKTSVEVVVRNLTISKYALTAFNMQHKIHMTVIVYIHRLKNSKTFVEVVVRN